MKNYVKFTYNSGGRCHPADYGEWEFNIAKSCHVHLTHRVQDDFLLDKSLKLEETECIQIWKYIEKMSVESLYFPSRPAVPDEVIHAFILETDSVIFDKHILHNNIDKIPGYMEFSSYLKKLIKKYAETEAIF